MSWKRSLPPGTKDKLFREANGTYELEKQVNAIVKKRGYQRIETPIIEFDEVFSSEVAGESNLYRFFDPNGRLLALRPDMTMPVGRVIATTGVTLPLKLSYSGKVFRSNAEMIGAQNEINQAGIELIGYSSMKAEVESLLCAYDILESLGIPNFHLELGHAKIYQGIMDNLQLDKRAEAEFRIHLLNKSLTDLAAFTEVYPSELDAFICELPKLFGDAQTILTKTKRLLPAASPILAAVEEMEALVTLVSQSRKDSSLTVDLGIVPTMSYYTGVIFSGYADLIPDIFLRGGRYDHLVEEFDSAEVPAVGLALNLDTLSDLQYKIGTLPHLPQSEVLIHYPVSSAGEAEALQKTTPLSQLSLFETVEESLAFAKRWHYREVWLLGPSGLEKIKVGDEG